MVILQLTMTEEPTYLNSLPGYNVLRGTLKAASLIVYAGMENKSIGILFSQDGNAKEDLDGKRNFCL